MSASYDFALAGLAARALLAHPPAVRRKTLGILESLAKVDHSIRDSESCWH